MRANSTASDSKNDGAVLNRGAKPDPLNRFLHPGQALRRILGRERFKLEHVYGVTGPPVTLPLKNEE